MDHFGRKPFLYCLIALLFLNPGKALTRILGVEFESYSKLGAQIKPYLETAQKNKTPIFVFMDLDHTQIAYQAIDKNTPPQAPLPMSTLGSETWFDWQLSLPERHPQRVYKTVNELVYINYFVGTLPNIKAIPSDPSLPSFIDTLKRNYKANIHELTARSGYYQKSTFEELKKLNIMPTPLLIQNNYQYGIAHPEGKNGFCTVTAIKWGALFLAGTHKGDGLVHYLKQVGLNQKPLIIFIDNKTSHIKSVAEKLDGEKYDAIVARFSGLDWMLNDFINNNSDQNKSHVMTLWQKNLSTYIKSPILPESDLFWPPSKDSSYFNKR